MPKIIYVQQDGTESEVDANAGDNLMETAVTNMVDGIVAECGGCMSCATCHVYIDEAWTEIIGPAEDSEKDMLQFAVDPKENSRLSCQVTIDDAHEGLIVRVPASQY